MELPDKSSKSSSDRAAISPEAIAEEGGARSKSSLAHRMRRQLRLEAGVHH